MDEQVIAAMAKWPNVPAVYGWLSLTESGQWRLHPAGDALKHTSLPGETITSPQILAFIDRNYAADEQGQWYFQNGPQRVYVRLDAAPFTAHTTPDPASGRLKLRTHTGLDIQKIHALYIDETGRLFLATDRGPALVAGRDVAALLDAFETDAEVLAEHIESGADLMIRSRLIQGFPAAPLLLRHCQLAMLEELLDFRRFPAAPDDPA